MTVKQKYAEPDASRDFSWDEDENGDLLDPRTQEWERELKEISDAALKQ
jgi:hypothetical protein